MSPIVRNALTGMQLLFWAGFFLTEIIIHCLPTTLSYGSFTQMLMQQTMWIFTYQGILLAVTLIALHMADSWMTRAARMASMTVQIFALLAWFYVLYFIIPTLFSAQNPRNLFCYQAADASHCRLARTVAAWSIMLEFGQLLITIYSIWRAATPPRSSDGTPIDLYEYDDAETNAWIHSNPSAYKRMTDSIRGLSLASLILVIFSVIGYAVLVFSMVKVYQLRGFYDGPQAPNNLVSNTWNMQAFFALSWTFRALTLLLGTALAVSTYACFRHNRGIQGAALFLTALTTLQWWSIIIFSGRDLTEGLPNTQIESGFWYVHRAAQIAMFVGMCMILAGETVRLCVLAARYQRFVPVTRQGVVPTYIRTALHGANRVSVAIFAIALVFTLTWFLLEFVSECLRQQYAVGQFNTTREHVVSDTLFITNALLLAAVFCSEFYAERTKTLSSKQAAFAVNVLCQCAFFLLMWPWVYATIFRTSFFMGNRLFTAAGFGAAAGGFCASRTSLCQVAQGAAILACMIGLMYTLLSIVQLCQLVMLLATPNQMGVSDGGVVLNALPPTKGSQQSLAWMAWLTLSGLLIWALTSIDYGSGIVGFMNYSFYQLPVNTALAYAGGAGTNPFFSPIEAYTYCIAFGTLVVLGMLVWSACETSHNALVANLFTWRTMVTASAALMFTFCVPILIVISRYTHFHVFPLGRLETALAAGVIVLCCGVFLLFVCALLAQYAPVIPLPVAIDSGAQSQQYADKLEMGGVRQPRFAHAETTRTDVE